MQPLTLDDFRGSRNGQAVNRCLESPSAIDVMVKLAQAGRSPLEALDAALPDDVRLANNEKHHAGRMVRDVMHKRGWTVAGQRTFPGGRVFSSGSIYKTHARSDPPGDPADGFRRRLVEAREIVRDGSKSDYGVNDFIRDKRAEAAREDERDARKYGR